MLHIFSLTLTQSSRPPVRHNPNYVACSRRSQAEPQQRSADGKRVKSYVGKMTGNTMPAWNKLLNCGPKILQTDSFKIYKLINKSELGQNNKSADYKWYFTTTKLYIVYVLDNSRHERENVSLATGCFVSGLRKKTTALLLILLFNQRNKFNGAVLKEINYK